MQTFSLYGLMAFEVQYWNGSTWATVRDYRQLNVTLDALPKSY
jgi:hypothetical protein